MSKRKAMGLALVAAMALTAVMATAAGAATYTSNKPHTILTGSQTTAHVFKATGGFAGISCTTATFAGTMESEAASTLDITPTYSGCKDTLGRTVHPHKSSTRHWDGAIFGRTNTEHTTITNGSATVVCSVSVEPQEGINGVSYKNLGGTNGIEVIFASNNIKSTVSGGILNCGVSNGEKTNGTYEGKLVIKGVGTDGLAAAISVD
jgi:hypothetical protein